MAVARIRPPHYPKKCWTTTKLQYMERQGADVGDSGGWKKNEEEGENSLWIAQ
jgi:hypothetical protein